MKKSNKEVLDFFGLKVGDKVIVEGCDDHYVIAEENGIEYAQRTWKRYGVTTDWNIVNFILTLLGNKYEVVKPKKKLGDMRCKDFATCEGCPFALDNPASNVCRTSEAGNGNKTFREIVELTQKELDDIKPRLDEEVEECEK